jgi:hypothetical protein
MTGDKLDSDLIQKKPGTVDSVNFPHKSEENLIFVIDSFKGDAQSV